MRDDSVFRGMYWQNKRSTGDIAPRNHSDMRDMRAAKLLGNLSARFNIATASARVGMCDAYCRRLRHRSENDAAARVLPQCPVLERG